jgi:hypothetical protein
MGEVLYCRGQRVKNEKWYENFDRIFRGEDDKDEKGAGRSRSNKPTSGGEK